ncbi:MAG TPA: hypothetical protein VFF52_02665 [Isosphaeraceae bacterium]|nr:hypothetical protein [Isosphaeraceae bacterium]
MLSAFMVVTVLVLLGILGVLIDIARNLRWARKAYQHYASCAFVVRTGDRHCGFAIKHIAGFSIWCYEQGKWTLLAHCGQPGCECGPPPGKPGSYEGQVVRKECPPK